MTLQVSGKEKREGGNMQRLNIAFEHSDDAGFRLVCAAGQLKPKIDK